MRIEIMATTVLVSLAAVLLSSCVTTSSGEAEGESIVRLENLKWQPKWVSHLGCLKGCLDYLDVQVSDAWLFGASGHAFLAS